MVAPAIPVPVAKEPKKQTRSAKAFLKSFSKSSADAKLSHLRHKVTVTATMVASEMGLKAKRD